jgi:methionine-rich copper-binding protein CopC
VELKTAAGAPVALSAKAAGDVIDATPKAALKPGVYTVTWKVLSTDGHKSQGAYNFTVK